MADDDFTELNPTRQPNGPKVAVDKIGGRDYQRIKLVHGISGTNDGDVAHTNPLPMLPAGHQYSKGSITGHETLRKFGSNSAVPTTGEFLEAGGTLTAPRLPTSAVTVEIVAADAADDAAGAGAQTVVIEGLDANFAVQTDTISLAGAGTSTATTNTYIRVFRAYVATVGTYGVANTGLLTIQEAGGGTFFQILAGRGRSQIAHYCVPAGYGYFIKDVHLIVDAAQPGNVYFWKLPDADDVTTPFSGKQLLQPYEGVSGQVDFEYTPEIYIPEKTDIWFTGASSAATAAMSAETNGILETM